MGERIRPRWKTGGALFLIYTALGLWNIAVIIAGRLASGGELEIPFALVDEFTAAYCGLALAPLLLWFFRGYPLRRENRWTRIFVYILASLAYSALWMFLVYSIRSVLFPALGWGPYAYGRLLYKFLMESLKMQLIFWISYGVISSMRAAREREAARIRASELEERLTRARLQTLEAQLHPHFLFNTLNAISSTMYEDVGAADRMIADLSELLRSTLAGGGRAEHPLSRERESAGLYVNLMKARFGEALAVNWNIPAETRSAHVPRFLLQPLIENAIKHGRVEGRATEIDIRAEKVEGRLRLTVSDNGPGISGASEQVLASGVGLSNSAERLERLYGDRREFRVGNRALGGFEVEVVIPFREGGSENRSDG